jgi:hypothetical protein
MSDPLKLRGESKFPEAGEGVFLFFRNSDLRVLEEEKGGQWFPKLVDEFLKGDISIEFINRLAKMGAKKRDPEGKRISHPLTDDDLDEIPVVVMSEYIFDALCLAMHGKPAREYVQERMDAFLESLANGEEMDPSLSSPVTNSSETSEGDVSGQE